MFRFVHWSSFIIFNYVLGWVYDKHTTPCPRFLVWDFVCLSLEISIQLFFLPFLLSGYYCLVDSRVVCIVSGQCNQYYFALLYEVFESLHRCINAIFHTGKSSSVYFRHLWDVRLPLWDFHIGFNYWSFTEVSRTLLSRHWLRSPNLLTYF